jgi:7-cyano-7-deazaguanine synthase
MNAPHQSSALVLFSGGQDSATCLAWALSRYDHVETIGFLYGQRHSCEMDVRDTVREALRTVVPEWRNRLGPDQVVPLFSLAAVAQSSLLGNPDAKHGDLPSTFVPGRNIVFFTFAAIVALQRGIKTLVAGTCETDYSGYPDCRDDTVKALQVALNLGMDARLVIETPLMWLDKAATWSLAADLGGDSLIRHINEETHTCYAGDRGRRHPWGYGCAECDACKLRARGWEQYTMSGDTQSLGH